MKTDLRHINLAKGVGAIEHSPAAIGISNCGFLRNRDGVVLIDSLMTPKLAARMCLVAGIERDTVHHIIVTHGHVDHVGGNSIFGMADIWGTPQTNRSVCELSDNLDICAKFMPCWADELRGMPIIAPGRELQAGRWTEQADGLGIEVIDVGRAHSESDIAIFVEECEGLFAGDLAFFGITPMLLPGGSLRGWSAALDRLAELPARWIVPGHGPVGGAQQLGELRRYFDSLINYSEASFSAGLPIHETIERLPRFGWHRQWAESERTAVNLYSAYLELKGGTTHLGIDEIEIAFSDLHQLFRMKPTGSSVG
jgi:glyoxylase-like metal-dependent hydrolase (beta-lactamase superfamily II)